MTGARPDPDALLARVQQEESRSRRGRLKVFVGASPGVGKTFSMLEAARAARLGGRDVVVGVVETHGRRETAALVEGLDVLPRKAFPHRGATLEEFDLDAALARRPSLILMDEMAHSNAPGARHAKRYQDIDELLGAGIDVFSTLNIQHLESLNDVVAQITGVTVRETVPDAVLDEADEIELVDVTPEVLEQRLREGKVYLPEQAQRALDRFFRRGNLIALRELALRRTAERVDEQMRGYRASAGIAEPWAASERLLVCISPSERSLRLVRSARRLAGLLRAPWTALYVELPRHATMPARHREAAQEALRLAEELDGTAVSVPGHDAAEEILAYARSHNVTRILVGRSRRGWLAGLFPASVAGRLVRGAEGMHVWVGADDDREAVSEPSPRSGLELGPLRHYVGAAFVVALMTAVALPFHGTLAEIDAAMLYLLAVVVAAARYGRGPSVLAGLLAVACFDIVFVQPYGTFAVSDGAVSPHLRDDARRGAGHGGAHDPGARAGQRGAAPRATGVHPLRREPRPRRGAHPSRTRPRDAPPPARPVRRLGDAHPAGRGRTARRGGGDARAAGRPKRPRRGEVGLRARRIRRPRDADVAGGGGGVPAAGDAGAGARRRGAPPRAGGPPRRPGAATAPGIAARPGRRRPRAHRARRGEADRPPRIRGGAAADLTPEFAVARPPHAAGRHRGSGEQPGGGSGPPVRRDAARAGAEHHGGVPPDDPAGGQPPRHGPGGERRAGRAPGMARPGGGRRRRPAARGGPPGWAVRSRPTCRPASHWCRSTTCSSSRC